METNIEEIWKDIVGYEGYYEVSNIGRIRSLSRTYPHWRSGLINKAGRIIKPRISKHGYLRLFASVHQVKTYVSVHRAVAIAFIPNPENKPQVNHKNCIKSDNRLENLEWATASENSSHHHKVKPVNYNRPNLGRLGINSFRHKEVYQISFDGFLIGHFGSAAEAHRATKVPYSSIVMCASGRCKRGHGYIWSY